MQQICSNGNFTTPYEVNYAFDKTKCYPTENKFKK